MTLASAAAQTLALAILASVVCDVIHALLHVSRRAPPPLSWPGALHQAHHRFLDEQLAFHPERFWRNVLLHQVPECAMRLAVVVALAAVLDADEDIVLAIAVLIGVELGVVLARRGHDAFHDPARPVPPPRSGIFVDGAYHAHHHAFPDHFLGAHVQLIDRALGRLLPLGGRRVVLVGGSRYMRALTDALSARGAVVLRCADDAVSDEALAAADVLVLGHGAGARDDRAYEVLVSRALAKRSSPLPLDVWAVGDDAAWVARRGAFADRALVRHLRRGPQLGASLTLFLLQRGARSV